MKATSLKFAVFLALFIVLAISLSTVPLAHADVGGTQVKVASATLSPDGTTIIVTVTATLNDPTVTGVTFDLSASFGSNRLNINKQGTPLDTPLNSVVATSTTQTFVATFLVPYQGAGYYLFIVNAYNAANGAWLGSDWVDPLCREGTGG